MRARSPTSARLVLFLGQNHLQVYYWDGGPRLGQTFSGPPETTLRKVRLPRNAEVDVLLESDLYQMLSMSWKLDPPPQSALRLNVAALTKKDPEKIVAAYVVGSRGTLLAYTASRELVQEVSSALKGARAIQTYPKVLAFFRYWKNASPVVSQGNGLWLFHQHDRLDVFVSEQGALRNYWRAPLDESAIQILSEAIDAVPRPLNTPLFAVLATTEEEGTQVSEVLAEVGFEVLSSHLSPEEKARQCVEGAVAGAPLEGQWNLTSAAILEEIRPPSLKPSAAWTLAAGGLIALAMFGYGFWAQNAQKGKIAQLQADLQVLDAQLGQVAGIKQTIDALQRQLQDLEGVRELLKERAYPALEAIARDLAPAQAGLENLSLEGGSFTGSLLAPSTESRRKAAENLRRDFELSVLSVAFQKDYQWIAIRGVRR